MYICGVVNWRVMNLRCLSILLSAVMLLCSVVARGQSADDDRLLDSLGVALRYAADKGERLQILEEIAFSHYNADSTVYYAQMEYDLASELDSLRLKECALRYLSWAYFFYNDYPKSCEYTYEAIVIADSIGDVYGVAKGYYNLGNAHSMMQDATTSNEYYHKALEIFESLGDSLHVGDVLRNIGQNNYENRMYDDALRCYEQALALDSLRGDWATVSEDYSGIGATYLERFRDNEYRNPDYSLLRRAKEYLLLANEIAAREDYSYSLMRVGSTLLGVMLQEYKANGHESVMDSCEMLFRETYAILDKADYDNDRYEIDNIYVEYLLVSGRVSEAKVMLDKMHEEFAHDANIHKEHMPGYYDNMSLYYQKMGNVEKALLYNNMYNEAMTASKRADYATKSIQAMAQARFSRQMAQRQREEDARTEKQKLVMAFVMTVLLLLMVVAVMLYRSFRRTRVVNQLLDRKNLALEEQKEEIATQNEYLISQKEQIEEQKVNLEYQNKIITAKNRQITDSINYASLIQQAALPSASQMNSIFGEHLVIYRPLNIVSGDFYWTSQVGRYKMLAVADCTGHGVPGAFLSMLGMSILNDISKDVSQESVSAGEMLDSMRQIFKDSLHQRGNEEDNHDGIDLALVIIDIEKMEMHYAGAFRPVLIFRDGEVIKLDADRMPIGVHYKEADHFTDHRVDLVKGDVIYIYSDGMTDQFGYDSDMTVHKFTSKRLKSLLTDVHRQPFSTQKMKIELALDKWRLDSLAKSGEPYEQTDDAILVGVRV